MSNLSAPRITALWVGTVQAVLVLTWTGYVLFLPVLAKQGGIPAHWVVWILVTDQAVFVVTDWASGVFADRLVNAAGRIGLGICVAALVSAGLLFSMPALAQAGQGEALLAAIGIWAILSSFLRAPVFSLLGKIGGASRKSGVVSLALFGISIAGAVGPLITAWLQRFDPRWSLGAASLALVVAGLFAMRVERLKITAMLRPAFTAWRPLMPLAGVAFLAAFGMQLHTAFGAAAAPAGMAKEFWVPLFWAGFAAGLVPAAGTSRSMLGLRWCVLALIVGAAAVGLAGAWAETYLVVFQLVAGAAWAIVLTGVLAAAIERGGPGGPASPIGVLLSAISLAAMARLLLVALHVQGQIDAGLWVVTIWLLAAIGLLAHPWTLRRNRENVS